MHTPTNKIKLKNTLPIPTQFSTTTFNKPFFQISHLINGEAEKFKTKAKTITVERLRSINVSCDWTSNFLAHRLIQDQTLRYFLRNSFTHSPLLLKYAVTVYSDL